MIRARQRFIFALDVDGKPTTAFEANNLREARELCKEKWLRDDLRALRSNGVSLLREGARLTVRRATEPEKLIFQEADQSVEPSGELVLAYLVDLDGPA
jgi:hypothetical protein